jgi:hypothetical protein
VRPSVEGEWQNKEEADKRRKGSVFCKYKSSGCFWVACHEDVHIYDPNMTSRLRLVSYEGEMVHILCLNHLWICFLPWLGNLTEENSCSLNEISVMATAPSVCAAVAQFCPRLQLLYKQNVADKHVKSILQISLSPQNPEASGLIPFLFYCTTMLASRKS